MFLPSLGKILLALASSSSCFLHGFQEITSGCTKPPSPELDCSSLVTLLLNNLQNGALPVFIGEAFQVCAADFLPSWRSCRGGAASLSLSCPAASPRPAAGVTSRAGQETAPRKNKEKNPCVPCPLCVLQAHCYSGALGKGHSHGGLERKCLGLIFISFFW